MGRKFLVIGGGGREHCLAWALSRSAGVEHVWIAPGNGGTAMEPGCSNVDLSPMDFDGLIRFARDAEVVLTVVGPEAPLAAGIIDAFQAAGLLAFGPDRRGARLEASKSWAKQLMQSAAVPTAAAVAFDDLGEARRYVLAHPGPLVIKADGLAQGKGVTVATDTAEGLAALDDLDRFGEAGRTVLIEEKLEGEEASVLAFTDGQSLLVLPPAQDHKRIGTADTGPNTGGMGAYTPAPIATPALIDRVRTEVLERILEALARQGIVYRGVLYAGLMISASGAAKVIEFNCRLGDPETQVLLPLLETPLDEVVLATAQGRLAGVRLDWKQANAACVVIAAGGYPGAYREGDEITGLEASAATGALVFHSGTRAVAGNLLTSGGRVLAVTGVAPDLAGALDLAYRAAAQIHFDGAYYRPDIGWRTAAR